MADGGVIELTFRAKLDRLERDLAEGKTKAGKAGADMGEELESKLGAKLGGGGIGKSLKKGMVAGATAAGVAGGTAAAVGFMGALEAEQSNANLAASLGLNDEGAKIAGHNAGALYASNFGESVGAAGDAIAAVFQGGLAGIDDADADIQRITSQVMTFSEVFRQDMSESVATVSALLLNKLVPDADTALDQLTVTMQQVPEILRGEILSALTEYSPFFAQLGISGSEAMSALAEASKGGTIAIDKTGDALKEMVIRVQDGSKLTADSLKALGLDVGKIEQGFAKGGPAAQDAMSQIIGALDATKDPVKQMQLGVALLGTPFEDLGANAMPTLNKLGVGLGDVTGKAEEMVDTVGGTGAAKLETFKRSMETNVNKTMESAIGLLDKLPASVQGGVATFAGFLPMLAPLAPIIGSLIPLLFGQAAAHTAAGTAAAGSSVGFFAAAAGVWAALAPLLLIALAIAAVVAVGVLLWKNWDTILAGGKAVFGWIGGAGSAALGFLKDNFLYLLGPIGLLIKHWDFFKEAGAKALGWVTDKLGGFLDFVTGIPDTISGALRGSFDGLIGAFKGAWNWIASRVNNISITIPSVLGFGGGRIDLPDLPILDEGGIVSRPTLALLAANSRPERVAPLDDPGWGDGSDGGGGGLTIIVQGSLVTERQLAGMSRGEFANIGRHNAGPGF